jgi:hypothetical protein
MENFLTGFFCYLTFSMWDNMSYGRIVHLRSMDLWQVKSCSDENRVLAGMHRARKNGSFWTESQVAHLPANRCPTSMYGSVRGLFSPNFVTLHVQIRGGDPRTLHSSSRTSVYAKSCASACAAASTSAAANTPETTAIPSAPASIT